MPFSLPPWLTPSNPAAAVARGFSMGLQAGAQQASQRFQQMQMARQQQLDAMQQARWEAELGLKAAETAAKHEAQMQYQQAIDSGMDPLQAIVRFGPAMGQQGSAEAAALRAMYQKEKTVPTWSEQETESGAKYMLSSEGKIDWLPTRAAETEPLVPGDVKTYHLLDPDTGRPLKGFAALPSPTGKGMTHIRLGQTGQLTVLGRENLRARYMKQLQDLQKAFMGMDLSEKAEPPKTENAAVLASWEEARNMYKQIKDALNRIETIGTTPAATGFRVLNIREVPPEEGEEEEYLGMPYDE